MLLRRALITRTIFGEEAPPLLYVSSIAIERICGQVDRLSDGGTEVHHMSACRIASCSER